MNMQFSDNERIHVVQIVNSLNRAGAEEIVYQFASYLKKLDHKVTVITLENTNTNRDSMLTNKNIEYFCLGYNKTNPIVFFLRLITTVNKLKKARPNIIHSHLPQSEIVGYLLSLIIGVPHVITYHNIKLGTHWRIAWRSFIARRAAIGIGCTTNVTMNIINKLDYSECRVQTITNSISIPDEPDWVEKEGVVAIGHHHHQKNYFLLIESIKYLKKTLTKEKIHVYGRFSGITPSLIKQSKQLFVDSLVSFEGESDSIIKVLTRSRIFVMSSSWEGLPVAMLEAMACGNIIVSTRVGGIPELLENTNNYLVDPDNSKLLAEALENAIRLPVTQQIKIGQENREHIKRQYSLNSYVKKHLDLYQKIVK